MTAFAEITLEDGVTPTPNDVVFAPSSIDPQGVARLFEADEDLSIEARRSISLSVKLPKAGGNVARTTAKVVLPMMDGSTPPVKIGDLIANVEFVMPKSAGGAQRRDLLALTGNFLADPSVVAAVSELESIY